MHTLIPALDKLTNTDLADEWGSTVAGRIELLAAGQSASVVHGDGLARLGEVDAIALLDSFDSKRPAFSKLAVLAQFADTYWTPIVEEKKSKEEKGSKGSDVK